jgi:hypothetical protein
LRVRNLEQLSPQTDAEIAALEEFARVARMLLPWGAAPVAILRAPGPFHFRKL